MKIAETSEIQEIKSLLKRCSLLTADVAINDKAHFFGAYHDENLCACVGVELYDDAALLRSLAVDPACRNGGIGKQLSEYIEYYCRKKDVEKVYLLTETAEKFFEKLGYKTQERANAPASIKGTAQFSGLCPCSSIFMSKAVNG